MAAAFGGLAIGAAAGGLLGLLKDHGISKEEAEFYAEGVRDGGSLVTLHGVSELRVKQARQILHHNGTIRVEGFADEPSGQTAEGGGDSAARSYNTCGEDNGSEGIN